jgi:uncharacterized protein with ParB-like and HNH nuclease domain
LATSNRRRALNHELLNVYDLFDSKVHYVVPRYQRGYAWTSEQVGILLDDLEESFLSSRDEEYLLGQIIVCPSEDPDKTLSSKYQQWDLIDGQQRCTTLYLMLLAMYKKLKRTKITSDGSLSREVSELHVLATHNLENKTEWPKIRPASNGIAILEALVNDLDAPDVEGPTAANLTSAWSQIVEYFENFPDGEFEDFLDYFQKQVVLIRLELDEAKHALRVFSKVNNRGLTLDDSDLIKNYLFQKVSSNDEFEKLAQSWNTAANTLYGSRLKKTQTMDFLLKLKVGIKTGKSISSSRIYDSWSSILTSEESVKEFARKLPDDAQTIKDISLNKVEQSGGYSDWNYFTGARKVVQHFEVLLAGSHLTATSYENFNRLVQDRMVLAVLSKTEKDFERLVHPWAKNVQDLDSNPSWAEVLSAAKQAEALDGLDDLFDTAFLKVQALRYSTQSHQETLRYLLARSSKILQDLIDSNGRDLQGYMQTTSTKKNAKKGYDLDHIFPKSKNQFQLHWKKSEDWDSLDDETKTSREAKVIHSLGNLVLLHPKDNREQSDSLPWDRNKMENFENSELYLNRLTVDKGRERFTSDHWEVIQSLGLDETPVLDNWSEDSVDSRAKIIWSLISNDMKASFRE